jgi:hypothetical protein
MDQQAQKVSVLGNNEYENMSKLGSRASALRPYHRQMKQSVGGTTQMQAVSKFGPGQNQPINSQYSGGQQPPPPQVIQSSYGARPSESQQRMRINRLNSAIEESEFAGQQQVVQGIPGLMQQDENDFKQTNRKLIHQSQSSSNFPQPRAFHQPNNVVYQNQEPGWQNPPENRLNSNEQAFRISINREDKVKNHLTKEVNPNLNLMFYDFNDYGQSQQQRQQNPD